MFVSCYSSFSVYRMKLTACFKNVNQIQIVLTQLDGRTYILKLFAANGVSTGTVRRLEKTCFVVSL